MGLAHGLLAGYGRFRPRVTLLFLCGSNELVIIDFSWF